MQKLQQIKQQQQQNCSHVLLPCSSSTALPYPSVHMSQTHRHPVLHTCICVAHQSNNWHRCVSSACAVRSAVCTYGLQLSEDVRWSKSRSGE
jgi:hypothetical protein